MSLFWTCCFQYILILSNLKWTHGISGCHLFVIVSKSLCMSRLQLLLGHWYFMEALRQCLCLVYLHIKSAFICDVQVQTEFKTDPVLLKIVLLEYFNSNWVTVNTWNALRIQSTSLKQTSVVGPMNSGPSAVSLQHWYFQN